MAPVEPTLLFIDFEYNERPGHLRPILLVADIVNPDGTEREVIIDLRTKAGRSELAALYHRYKANGVWFSYSALAEGHCFEALGLDARQMNWVCLMAEAKQILGSHDRFWVPVNAVPLLMALQRFGIPSEYTQAQKDAIRDLIITQDEWSLDEWLLIVRYCQHDVKVLHLLWQRIQAVHRNVKTPWNLDSALFHGDYLGSLAHLEAKSPGFPVDVELLHKFYEHLPMIKEVLVTECNAQYGNRLFLRDKAGDWHFKPGGLKLYLEDLRQQGITIEWNETGKAKLPNLQADYLDELASRYPHFKPLATTRRLLNQLKRSDLRSLLRDAYIKGVSLPYHTVTSRNQPLSKSGFLLNLPAWMRCLMRPPPGKVIVAADWSQQEVVLAAALSGDPGLVAAIRSGDVYLYMGKLAGHIPQDGTKATHRAERETFKTLQLGIQYGMGRDSLARNLYLAMLDQQGMTYEAAYRLACDLLDWHKRTFAVFWHWKSRIEAAAMHAGYIASKDMWIMFAGRRAKPTTLGNFPCQCNGAAMMRQAVKRLAKEPDLTFIASHHDALYLLADEADVGPQRGKIDFNLPIGPTEAKLVRCMNAAAQELIDCMEDKTLIIKVDVAIYSHEAGYFDERPASRQTYERVMTAINQSSVAPGISLVA